MAGAVGGKASDEMHARVPAIHGWQDLPIECNISLLAVQNFS